MKGAVNMLKYIVKRLLLLIPVIIGTSALVFFIMALAPGDPATAILGADAEPEAIEYLREELGLNDPEIVQYGRYMWDLIHGDLGESYLTGKSVLEEYFLRFPATFKLTLWSMVIALLISIPIEIGRAHV